MKRDWLGLIGGLGLVLMAVGAVAQVSPGVGTVNDIGSVRRLTYKSTVGFALFTAAAVTNDITVATLPSKTRLVGFIADVTQAFVCAGTCTTSTLSMTCGKSAGGAEYLASFDIDSAAITAGLTQAQLAGGLLVNTTATTPIQGGDLTSTMWGASTTLQCRLTSGTGNIGTGTASNFNAGSITFYVTTEQMP